MAMLQVDGGDIPTPSQFTVGIADVNKKATRNANGKITIERITTKRKLDLAYNYLSQSDASTLLQAISDVFFEVTYPDPQLGTTTTKTFYVGDRNTPMLDFQNSVPRYKDVAFSFIEQ